MKYEVRRKTLAKKNVIVVATLVIAAMLMIAVVLAIITSSKTVPSSGTIAGVNLGVYLDSECTDQVYSINWTAVNPLNPGFSVTQQVYIVNKGTTDMTLSLSNSTWSPSDADKYLTLTWNLEPNTVVQPGVSNAVPATLTLSASDLFTTGTTFTGDVIISGSHT
jgi:hypothetical protein